MFHTYLVPETILQCDTKSNHQNGEEGKNANPLDLPEPNFVYLLCGPLEN